MSAAQLRERLTAAINEGKVPEAYLEELSGAANELQLGVPKCIDKVPPPPPDTDDEDDEEDDDDRGKKDKKRKKEDKDDEEDTTTEPVPTDTLTIPDETTTGETTTDETTTSETPTVTTTEDGP